MTKLFDSVFAFSFAMALTLTPQPGAASADEGIDFFESKVRPLLIEHCFECHSGEDSKGGLLLDSRDGWQKGGQSGPAVVAGMPEESLLIHAIRYDDADAPMPPDGKLPDEAIELFRRWVAIGAPDPRIGPAKIGGMTEQDARSWWAFQSIGQHAPPAIEISTSKAGDRIIHNDIDRFIESRLADEGIKSNGPADRRSLIRRATYDLTGLPPTADEVEAFVNDPSADAFEKLVDRLLSSPHYGERWGRHWLDVVRYADTAGENTDRPLTEMWRYRNWVIDAINDDMPWDRFTRMQIAGDLIHGDANRLSGNDGSDAAVAVSRADGLVATGYLALARRFGHDIDKENHLMHEDVIDNLGKAFLGLTLSCARCHDHKYDPITAEDYYAIYGILDSSRFSFPGCEAKGQPRDLVPMLTDEEAEAMRRPWLDIRSGFDARIGQFDAATLAAVASWNKSLQTAKTEIAAADVDEAASVRISDAYKIPSGEITVRKGDTLLLVVSPKGNHGADSTRVRLDIAEVVGDAGGEARTWRLEDLAADFARGNPHPGVTEAGEQWSFLDMKAEPAFLGERIDGYQGQSAITIWQRGETPSAFANTSDQPITVWTELPPKSVFVHPGPEGPVAVAWTSPIDGVITVDGEVADAHPAPGLDGVAFSLLHIASPDSGAALAEIARLTSERATEIANRDRVSGPEPVVPVAFAVVDAEPRTTRVHLQGDPEKPGAEVPRRWIKILGGAPVEDTSSSGRAELADWIAGHPIATRVLVNRVWQQHFGKGIVASVNDFGSRGQPPTHPELLERLCEQFVADGRRLKPLHRMIMLSAAYQRSSDADADAIGRDPGNQWLSRFDRRRLSAEELRDSLLSVSGRLDRQPGGAHPFPKPETWGYTQHGPFNAVYDDSRRTVYQMVQRQRRHPFLALFDGADPNASTGTRQTTTVPTQALYFLNDPFFHAQSEAVAGIVMQSDGEGARFGRLMAITLQRAPLAGEPEYAIDFMARYPGDESQKWAALARLILAGNEFLHID